MTPPPGFEATRLAARLARADAISATVVHMTAGEGRAEEIVRLLRDAAPGLRAVALPPWDRLPYDGALPSAEAMGRRLAVLRALASPEPPRLVVASPAALLQRVRPPGSLRTFAVRAGDTLDPEALHAFCLEAGYGVDDRVDEPGEAAFRGEVAEVYPGAEALPFRIDLGDGRVAAIRRFDPATQRSTGEVEAVVIDMASEIAGRGEDEHAPRGAERLFLDAVAAPVPIFDHVPGAVLSVTPEAEAAWRAALGLVREGHRERARLDGPADRTPEVGAAYLDEETWTAVLDGRPVERIGADGFEPVPAFAEAGRAAFAAFLRDQAGAGRRVVLLAASPRDRDRLARRARSAKGEDAAEAGTWAEAAAARAGAVVLLDARLERGFVDAAAGVAAVTARDVLGSRAEGAPGGPAAAPWLLDAAELHEGDLVVHLEHGLGRLDGLETLAMEGLDGDAIRLGYAEGGALLVPAPEAGRVWRYGPGEGQVALDRLDGASWPKRRAKVAAGLAETARALLAAAAERDAREAPRLQPAPGPFERVAARFPYEETADQARAIRDALADLASGRPMDRLVVGDVGFGKTEVAIRAAAAAALAGRQVAVIAPTTVLARQHMATFARRFEGTDVAQGHLSRLTRAAEARRVREGLADGAIRLVTATHALLSKDVRFADLGLVVVDEEQRFGAEHKRRLRDLSDGVHHLAMTATPIPRTLQAALLGLQDLSVIATPPARRRPIRTALAPRDAATLRQALLREARRGGQSFVVVPRVEDVDAVAAEVRGLLPRLRLRVAHGRMAARAIDEEMTAFADGDGDVLLATAIIESGLDVPRANTMLVLRPELFGLAQLHQLRGRVGRGSVQAFCYLLADDPAALGEAAVKRLGTLQALDRLGAGLSIAAQDLDQRGAGELFGDRQTGHVKLIGLALYQDMLASAIRQARGEPAEAPEVDVVLDAPGHLPAPYIPEPEVRLNLHHRLARTRDAGDVEALAAEIADRFGPPPPEALRLLDAARIRALARTLGVTRVAAGPEAVALDFAPGVDVPARFADALAGGLDWIGDRLVLRQGSDTPDARMALALQLLEDLA